MATRSSDRSFAWRMPCLGAGGHDHGMSSHIDPQSHERARARDAANRDRYAIRRTLRGMTAELHHLEREAHDFDVRVQDTKDAIEEIWLVEHWGKEPVQPPAWRTRRLGA
jgi:hypothetical protein